MKKFLFSMFLFSFIMFGILFILMWFDGRPEAKNMSILPVLAFIGYTIYLLSFILKKND